MSDVNASYLRLRSLHRVHIHTGVVLASTIKGTLGAKGLRRVAGHRKKIVGHMLKYAVFDIKLTFNH